MSSPSITKAEISKIVRDAVESAVDNLLSRPTPEVFDTGGAADYLAVSRAYLERARHEGTGPKYAKFANLVRYRREDLDQWLAQRIVRSTSEAGARRA